MTLTISPINSQAKSKSNIDYQEQILRTNEGIPWCWDDSKYNRSRPDDWFGFMFYGKKVVIHKIISVRPPSDRLPSWSQNVGQTDRNVVELSQPICTIEWKKWVELGGPQARMGTYTVRHLSEQISELFV